MVKRFNISYLVVPARSTFPFQRSKAFASAFKLHHTLSRLRIYIPVKATTQ